MDSHQSIVTPLKNLIVVTKPDSPKTDHVNRSSGTFSGQIQVHRKEDMVRNSEGFIGVLEVYIHQARDIQNICIYHKQDVYAKLCLTSNPEITVSTQIINGGGRSPVFNENLQLNVQTLDSSLKCEIWMLSRVRNYMEDQLLGFSLVPLSDILIMNGKIDQEFSLSSTDLFHSPAGFVGLSLSYAGALPEIMAIPSPRPSMAVNTATQDSNTPNSLSSDFDKIEFPDPKIVNETQMMVSEYFGISCSNLENQSSESLNSSETDNHYSTEIAVPIVEKYPLSSPDSVENHKVDTPSVSTNSSPSSSGALKSLNQDQTSSPKEKETDVSEVERKSSSDKFAQSVLKVNIEPEQNVVRQEIADMYMKSLHQFTESLGKMKLPTDIETEPTNLGNGSVISDKKSQASKGNGSRVFYGSRAFF